MKKYKGVRINNLVLGFKTKNLVVIFFSYCISSYILILNNNN